MKLENRKISESFLFTDPLVAGILLTVLCGVLSLGIHSNSILAFHYGMIIVTQAHFALAYFFFFTSPQVQAPGGWKRLLPLLGLSIVLSAVYLMNKRIVDGLGLVFLYFTWHLIRDEVFFRVSKDTSRHERILLAILTVATLFLIYIFTVGKYLLHVLLLRTLDRKDLWMINFTDYRQEISCIGGIALVLSILTFIFFAKKYSVSWISFYRKFKKIFNLFLGFFVISFLACLFRFNAWIIIDSWIMYHVSSWYWFSIQKIRRSTPKVKYWKDWPRSTTGRFNLIYGSVQLIILIGFILFFYYGAENTFLKYYYSRWYFNVWTIFHITLSFFPKKSPKVVDVEEFSLVKSPLVVPGHT